MIEETPAATPGGDVRRDPSAQADTGGWLPSQIAALAAVATAGLIVSLTMSVLIPVLPQVADDLHSSTTSTEWLLTSTLLTAAVAVPIAGRLGDLYGKRLMLIVSAGFLTVGSLICALSHSLIPLIIGRGVTGLSLATVSLGVSLINVTLPARRALRCRPGQRDARRGRGARRAAGRICRRARRLPLAVLDLRGRGRRLAARQLAVPARGPGTRPAGSTSAARSCSLRP